MSILLTEPMSGYPDVQARALEWARTLGVLRIEGVTECAHGAYGYDTCPAPGAQCIRTSDLDHAHWYAHVTPVDGPRVFLLVHAYDALSGSERANRLMAYATAHGFTCDSYPWDSFYSETTTPWRLAPFEEYVPSRLSLLLPSAVIV